MTLESSSLELEKLLAGKRSVAIISHFNPDGDACGSSMGLYSFLHSRGIHAEVVLPSRPPVFLDFLDKDRITRYYTDDRDAARQAVADSDLIVCLDFNRLDRTEWLQEDITAAAAAKVMIDHHPYPETEGFSIVISDPSSSSTCELLYRTLMCFSSVAGVPERIGKEALTAITTGLLTDTNNFSNSLTPYTFTTAAGLLQAGADFESIGNMIFRRYTEDRMRLMGHLLLDSMEIDRNTGSSCMVLTLEDRERFNFQDGDSEGLVNLPLMIKDVEVSAIFCETKEFIRVSLRSKGNVSVNALANRYFNGGGHEKAAGGRLTIPISDVRRYFKESMEQFLQHH